MTDRRMPSSVDERLSWFDRFAGWAAVVASRAAFFVFCVGLVLVWAPSFFVFGSVDTWQLVINTATTIVTFLMVALLQNSQHRADKAVQRKLNAIAAALDTVLRTVDPDDESGQELQAAIGLEEREGA